MLLSCLPLRLQNSILSTGTGRSRNSPLAERATLSQGIQNGKDRYAAGSDTHGYKRDVFKRRGRARPHTVVLTHTLSLSSLTTQLAAVRQRCMLTKTHLIQTHPLWFVNESSPTAVSGLNPRPWLVLSRALPAGSGRPQCLPPGRGEPSWTRKSGSLGYLGQTSSRLQITRDGLMEACQ